MLGVIGLGQAGGNIANLFAERGVPSIVINYSSKDLDTCDSVEHKLKLRGSEGVGKQREEAIRLFHSNYEQSLLFVKEHLSSPSIEAILIIFSAAGGSGSGIASILPELLMHDMTDKTVILCPILPTSQECITAQLNTMDTLSTLSDLNACIVPLDNQKGIQKEGRNKSFQYMNETFVNQFVSIVEYTEKHSSTGNFDSRDFLTLFSTPGFCSIGEVDLSVIKSDGLHLTDEGITERIQKSHLNSICTNPSFEQVVRMGLIFDGQESLMRHISVSKITSEFANQPLDSFEGYYHSGEGRVISIYTGLTFNPDRLNQIQTQAEKNIQSFNNAHKSTSITVNRPSINIPSTKPKTKTTLSDILSKHKGINLPK